MTGAGARLVNETDRTLRPGVKDAGAPPRPAGSGAERRVLRVWIADDNQELRELLGDLLNQQPGIRCRRWFPSAEAILATLAEERPPDMILLDVNMGGLSGLEAIQPILKLAPAVKVVIWTLFSNSHYEARAFRAGAAGFLLKSYEVAEIVALLHEAHRNPGSPALFPTLVLDHEAEQTRAAMIEPAEPKTERKPFSLAGAFRQLCGRGTKRPTGSAA